jgi:6,7-dimethyl-8-ribityllumazine synthase
MSFKIAILSASWNTKIVNAAEDSFIASIKGSAISDAQVDVFKVPGSLEIPLAGKQALDNGYDIAVGIGFVVNGGIYRHEFVGHTVVQSILDVQLQTNKPFLSVVLTPQAYCEHLDVYEEMYVKHMVEKGTEAAKACEGMLAALKTINA